MRLFIAIPLPKYIITELDGLQQEIRGRLRGAEGGIKWVRPENIHLTVKFLGEAADSQVDGLCRQVSRTARGAEQMTLAPGSAGTFGRPARVLWLAVAENRQLHRLHDELDEVLSGIGFRPDRRAFKAHLTLARIKRSKSGIAVRRAIEGVKGIASESFEAEQLNIYKSELTKHGPEYNLISTNELGKTNY